MTNDIKSIKTADFLLMFLLMGVSGNPAFAQLGSLLYLATLLIILIIFGKRISIEGWHKALKWSALFVVIFIGQYFTLKTVGFFASVNYIVKVLLGLFAAYVFKEEFPIVYLRVMYVLCIIALALWALNNVGIVVPTFIHFDNNLNSILVYSQRPRGYGGDGLLRNYGMFWEPGAFSGYILVAFFLYINRLDFLWKEHKKECIVLLIALISTFSTTGYIILGLMLFFFFSARVKNRFLFILVGSVVVVVAVRLFNTLDFLGEKVLMEYEAAMAMGQYDVSFSRFGALIFDLQYIKMHPIFGNGLLNVTRYALHINFAKNLSAFGNGFSGEIAYFGIPFMVIYLLSVFRNPSLKKKWQLLLVLVLVLQGEYFMNYPLFFIFPFVMFFNETTNEPQFVVDQNE